MRADSHTIVTNRPRGRRPAASAASVRSMSASAAAAGSRQWRRSSRPSATISAAPSGVTESAGSRIDPRARRAARSAGSAGLMSGSGAGLEAHPGNAPDSPRPQARMRAADRLNRRFGGTVTFTAAGRRRGWKLRNAFLSPAIRQNGTNCSRSDAHTQRFWQPRRYDESPRAFSQTERRSTRRKA
jgi:hypothetical protein